MTKQQFGEWLTGYGDAWVSLNPDAVMSLIDKSDLTYYDSAFTEPRTSWDEVHELWQAVPHNQKNVTFWHEILMVDGEAVLAHVKVTRTMIPSDVRQDIDAAFMFRVNGQGLCTYFRQWRMLR